MALIAAVLSADSSPSQIRTLEVTLYIELMIETFALRSAMSTWFIHKALIQSVRFVRGSLCLR